MISGAEKAVKWKGGERIESEKISGKDLFPPRPSPFSSFPLSLLRSFPLSPLRPFPPEIFSLFLPKNFSPVEILSPEIPFPPLKSFLPVPVEILSLFPL